MWKEFKEFSVKGNMLDLAIGVIIGGAFGKIVTSIVSDLIMPIISLLTGKIDFSNLFLALNGKSYATIQQAKAAGVSTINYGVFITTVIDFLIIALTIFMLIKQINRFKRQDDKEEEKATKQCPFCMTDVHVNATRCPHCTSELEPIAQKE